MSNSDLEEAFAIQLKLASIPFLREVKVVPGRKFRWDFQVKNLLIEIQGGIWGKGGHSTGKGITRDSEKLDLATLEGFYSMNFTGEMIKNGSALKFVQAFLEKK